MGIAHWLKVSSEGRISLPLRLCSYFLTNKMFSERFWLNIRLTSGHSGFTSCLRIDGSCPRQFFMISQTATRHIFQFRKSVSDAAAFSLRLFPHDFPNSFYVWKAQKRLGFTSGFLFLFITLFHFHSRRNFCVLITHLLMSWVEEYIFVLPAFFHSKLIFFKNVSHWLKLLLLAVCGGTVSKHQNHPKTSIQKPRKLRVAWSKLSLRHCRLNARKTLFFGWKTTNLKSNMSSTWLPVTCPAKCVHWILDMLD